jgi:hypothetical protein
MAIIQIRFNVDSITPDQSGNAGFVQPIEGHGEHAVKIESIGTGNRMAGGARPRDSRLYLFP